MNTFLYGVFVSPHGGLGGPPHTRTRTRTYTGLLSSGDKQTHAHAHAHAHTQAYYRVGISRVPTWLQSGS
jgi:hypothetical protein